MHGSSHRFRLLLRGARVRTLLIAAAALATGGAGGAAGAASGAQPRISFAVAGGDAWTFEKRLEGSIEPGACGEVVIESPRGAVAARVREASFTAVVPLAPGENRVRALCRAGGETRAAVAQTWQVRLRDVPVARAAVEVTGDAVLLDAGGTERAPVESAPIVSYRWSAGGGNPEPLRLAGAAAPQRSAAGSGHRSAGGAPAAATAGWSGPRIALAAPRREGDYQVKLRATDARGRSDQTTVLFRVERGRPRAVDPVRERPLWVDRAVVYGAVPYFFPGQDLEGVTGRLDEIAELGATVVWLSPVTAAPPDDFGYAVTDHFAVNDRLGDDAALRRLVATAHDLGLRVLLDFVPNHVGDRHPYHRDLERRGERSPYHGFFERGEDGEIERYFDWEHLANLDYDHPEVERWIVEAFSYWVREVGVDGFRVDAAWGVAARDPSFWARWRRELKRIDPDLLLLGEAGARGAAPLLGGFDAAYDWAPQIGRWAWEDAFAPGAPIAPRLRRALAAESTPVDAPAESSAPAGLVLRFLDNNDTGERFVARHGVETTRVAATMLFTLPGLPLVYTGSEVGAAFEPYDEGPPLEWRDPHGLAVHYRSLAALRREVPALRSPQLELVATSHDDAVLAYLRGDGGAGGAALVLLNWGPEPVRLAIAPGVIRAIAGGSGAIAGESLVMIDRLSGETLAIDRDAPEVTVTRHGARVLQAPAQSAGARPPP